MEPLYKKRKPKIKELTALGMTNIEISEKLKISRKTIRKASLTRTLQEK